MRETLHLVRAGRGDMRVLSNKTTPLFGALSALSLVFAANAASEPPPPFQGKIAVNAKDSVPHWPQPPTAPPGAPNILLILLDDVGFADTSTFGGRAQTPALDRLAAEGLRYNRFHTAAICSPTRAALLSGRNAHRVGYGAFGGIGYPGYDGLWKKNAVSVAEVLRRNGYSTAVFGKWHNTPYYEMTPVGPFDRWPTQLGFEYFYGFMGGVTSQWEPELWRNTVPVPAPATPEQGYHFTTDIADEAIRWVRTHDAIAPQKPYFLYFATAGAHHPHHVPREWIERYRGQFDAGWDRMRQEIFARQKKLGVIPTDALLTPRPSGLPAWRSLSADLRQLLARQMEVYAAFIAHTDHQIGRLVQAVRNGPRGDDTLILYIVGDNGPDPWGGVDGAMTTGESVAKQMRRMDELGGPQFFNFYSAGWAWVGSTPFQGMKFMASHFGGTRNPLVVSWPARIKDRGGLRSQFAHVNDVAATLYEAAGVEFPEVVDGVQQLPLDGASLVATFDSDAAVDRHRTQYFEAQGNRAIYQDGWIASASHYLASMPVPPDSPLLEPSPHDFSQDRWELYHVAEDFSQARDLAARYPLKLAELRRLFDEEAHKNNVYPLGAGSALGRSPEWEEERNSFTFHPGFPPISMGVPNLSGPHRITAEALISGPHVQGVLVSRGGRQGGVVLYVKDRYLIYENNVRGEVLERMTSTEPLPPGEVKLAFELDSRSIGRLFINDRLVGERSLSRNAPRGALNIGRNTVSPVSELYRAPFEFTGVLKHVTVEIK